MRMLPSRRSWQLNQFISWDAISGKVTPSKFIGIRIKTLKMRSEILRLEFRKWSGVKPDNRPFRETRRSRWIDRYSEWKLSVCVCCFFCCCCYFLFFSNWSHAYVLIMMKRKDHHFHHFVANGVSDKLILWPTLSTTGKWSMWRSFLSWRYE